MFELTALKEKEIQAVLNGAYRVMADIGLEVKNDEALKIFASLGCSVEGTRVKIPGKVVDKALETVPDYIKIYDREGNLAMNLGGKNSYYGAGPTCTHYIDNRTGQRRKALKKDAAETALISDALPNIDYLMSLVMISDKTDVLADLHEMDAMIRNTTKPIATWAFTADNTQDIIDMGVTVRGSLEQLQEKPYMIVYAEPTTPLSHCKEALDKLMLLAKNKVPVIYSPGMIFGGTAPVTIAGAMTVGIAESLSGLVLHQSICPGAPFISSSGGTTMDMKQMSTPFGSAESMLAYAISAEIYRYLGIPSFGLAGATEAKTVDAQAGFESAIQIFINENVGANLIHDVGFMDYGLVGSCHQLVLGNEIIGHVKRIARGIEIDEEHLAFDTVKQVGPGGNFLAEEHTFKYFRSDIMASDFPNLVERRSYETWEKDGKKTMEDRIHETIAKILDNHKAAILDEEIAVKLDEIMDKAEARIKNSQ